MEEDIYNAEERRKGEKLNTENRSEIEWGKGVGESFKEGEW